MLYTLFVAVYLWIPGYEDVEMSMKVTEALCAVSQFICSLLIVLWMWKHSRSLSSVIRTCSTTPGGTQPPDVSPYLILTPRVAVNQLLLWFIIIQAVYEGILYGLWYMIYDMNIVSVFLKVLFLILQLWITLIIRYPQVGLPDTLILSYANPYFFTYTLLCIYTRNPMGDNFGFANTGKGGKRRNLNLLHIPYNRFQPYYSQQKMNVLEIAS